MVILGEYPSLVGWIGIWIMVIGTYILNIQGFVENKAKSGETTWRDWLAPFLRLGKSRGVQFAFLSAMLATFSLNFDALAYRSVNIAFAAVCIFTIAASGSLGIAIATGELRRPEPKGSLGELILPAVFLTLAILVGNLAFHYAIAPYVGTLRRLSIPVTIILAYLIAGEKAKFKERMVGGSLMALGATLIALT